MTFRREPGSGWMRYRGEQGRRGRPNVLRVAAVDLQHAIDALAHAKIAVLTAASPDVADGDRERALREARQLADLGARFTRGVLRGVLSAKAVKPPKAGKQLSLRLKPRR